MIGRKDFIHAKAFHEPAFLVLGCVARAGHRAGVSDRSCQLRLPPSDDASDDRLAEFNPALVVTAGLGVEHRGLAAHVIVECMSEVARCIVDIDVFSRRDERARPPTFRAEILRDRGCEAAGIRKDSNRSLEQYFFRVIAAQRALLATPSLSEERSSCCPLAGFRKPCRAQEACHTRGEDPTVALHFCHGPAKKLHSLRCDHRAITIFLAIAKSGMPQDAQCALPPAWRSRQCGGEPNRPQAPAVGHLDYRRAGTQSPRSRLPCSWCL